MKGRVLNVGSGTRIVDLPNAEEVINLDIFEGENIDVVSNAENMPFEDSTFDSILNIAVLEHVENPWKVVEEMARVLKPEGKIICCAPFFSQYIMFL